MPVRFTSPSLGASSGTALNEGQWQTGLAYRYLHANRFYVGHAYRPDRAPSGMPVHISVHTVELTLTYAVTNRVAVNVGIPVATASETRAQGDAQLHTRSASGVGDIYVTGSAWMPTGRTTPGEFRDRSGHQGADWRVGKDGDYAMASGATTSRALDPSIRRGTADGGSSSRRTGSGRYSLASLHTRLPRIWRIRVPTSGVYVFGAAYRGLVARSRCSDEYSAHAGLTYRQRRGGLTMSLGGRIDGVPVRDWLGGGDDSFRRPGYVVYSSRGSRSLSPIVRSPRGTTLSLTVPFAVDQNRKPSTIDAKYGQRGGGDFARYLILSDSRRVTDALWEVHGFEYSLITRVGANRVERRVH